MERTEKRMVEPMTLYKKTTSLCSYKYSYTHVLFDDEIREELNMWFELQ